MNEIEFMIFGVLSWSEEKLIYELQHSSRFDHLKNELGFKRDKEKLNIKMFASWWFQPIWKIWVKLGSSSPIFGVKMSKNLWVATTFFFECLSWSLSHPSSCFPFRQHVAFGNEKIQHQGSHSKHVLPHVRLPQVHGLISKKPSRELTYPTLGKGKSSSKCHFGMGYVSSLEGNHLRSIKPYPANHRTYFCMKSWCLKTLVYQPI